MRHIISTDLLWTGPLSVFFAPSSSSLYKQTGRGEHCGVIYKKTSMPEQSCSLLLNHTAPQRRIAECKREHRQLYWTACARLSISSALTDIGESSQCRRVKAINLQKTQHFSGVKSTALIIDATGFLTSFKGRRVARLALIQVSVQVRRELFSTRRWFRRWLSLREPKPPQNSFVPLVE